MIKYILALTLLTGCSWFSFKKSDSIRTHKTEKKQAHGARPARLPLPVPKQSDTPKDPVKECKQPDPDRDYNSKKDDPRIPVGERNPHKKPKG